MDSKNGLIVIFALVSSIYATQALRWDRQWIAPAVPESITGTTSILEHASFSHARRDNTASTPNATINLASMPSCVQSHVINGYVINGNSTPCSPVFNPPCPTGLEENCTNIEVSSTCFCNQPAPLAIGWNCPWLDWILAENWYSKQCPDVPPVNFSGVPACARSCLQTKLPHSGCVTSGVNCFCAVADWFGCAVHCSKSENSTIFEWNSSLCSGTANTTGTNGTSNNPAKPATTSRDPSKTIGSPPPLHWYEIFPLVVACVSVFAAFACYVLISLSENPAEELEEKVVAEDQVELLVMDRDG